MSLENAVCVDVDPATVESLSLAHPVSDASMEHAQASRRLLIESKKFAEEFRLTSWFHLGATLLLYVCLTCIVGFNKDIWMRSACSGLIALTIVRMFIIYHDFMHGAILKGSKLAGGILHLYGHMMLTPPTVWRRSHDHHHHHNSKLHGSGIGSFPVMTKLSYQSAKPLHQFAYRMARSPMLILMGYFTVFLFGMCLEPIYQNFRRNWGNLVTLVVHFGAMGIGIYLFGITTMLFAFMIPAFIATLLGAYLFYIQHNFPGAQMHSSPNWTYADAAMDSSSFVETGPVLRWFLGNIGFHHVHHLNSKIPFYRLPEAMAGLPMLQQPGKTSFSIRDINACLRLKLWDCEQNKFVSFSGASR